MDDRSTPGQVAYEAYRVTHPDPDWEPAEWRELVRREQQRWEAAAQAVLAQGTPQEAAT